MILVVLSDTSGPYAEVTAGLKERLRGSSLATASLVTLPWQDYGTRTSAAPPTLVVAVGVKAMQTVLSGRTVAPVLCGLVPRRAFDTLQARLGQRESSGRATALFLDQPLARQLDLIRIVLPEQLRIGVLLGAESEWQLAELRGLARERRVTLTAQIVETEGGLAASLQKVAEASDALWMLPDTSISNAQSVRDLLVASYRYKRPVIGFSQGYVRAGALAAVYSTPTQVGHELAAMLLQMSAEPARVPAARYATQFEVALNYHVARAYGLQLDDEKSVLRKLRALERLP